METRIIYFEHRMTTDNASLNYAVDGKKLMPIIGEKQEIGNYDGNI